MCVGGGCDCFDSFCSFCSNALYATGANVAAVGFPALAVCMDLLGQ